MAHHRHKRETNARRQAQGRLRGRPPRPPGDRLRRRARRPGQPTPSPATPASPARLERLQQRRRPRAAATVSRADSRLDAVPLERATTRPGPARPSTPTATRGHPEGDQEAPTPSSGRPPPLNLWTARRQGRQEGRPARRRQEGPGHRPRRAPSRVEIVIDGKARWVTAGYLSDEKPVAAAAGPGALHGSSGASAGRRPHRRRGLHQRHLGVQRGQPQHRRGARGRLRRVPGDHDLRHLPRRRRARPGHRRRHHGQRRPRLGGRGVRPGQLLRARRQLHHLLPADLVGRPRRRGLAGMEDRGSTTANHYDHVHVTTY